VVDTCEFDKDAELISASELQKLVKKTRFNTVKVRYTLFIPRYSIFKRVLFLEDYLKWLPLGGQYYIFAQK
jgi:hypothetical protein